MNKVLTYYVFSIWFDETYPILYDKVPIGGAETKQFTTFFHNLGLLYTNTEDYEKEKQFIIDNEYLHDLWML